MENLSAYQVLGIVVISILGGAIFAILPMLAVLYGGDLILRVLPLGKLGRFLLLMFKSLRRNMLRTCLTYLATFILVMVVTLIWSTLYYLDLLTKEKNKDLKVVISEKHQRDSRMPFSYASALAEGAMDPSRPDQIKPQDSMTWQFYVGTMDKEKAKNTRDDLVFVIAMEPKKMVSVMESLFDDIDARNQNQPGRKRIGEDPAVVMAIEMMEKNKRGIILGKDRLKAINKEVGERFQLKGINYQDLDLEFEIVGIFPDGRFNQSAVMNRDYFNDALDAYPRSHSGRPHALAAKSLNLVWLQVPDKEAYSKIVSQIEASGRFQDPSVKIETLSAGIANALEGFQSLIFGMRWLLAPAILFTMTLVIANAISISVRERRQEIAVLKVLGYQPLQILFLVLGEAVLIGAISGFLSGSLTWVVVDHLLPYDPRSQLYVPIQALYWGPAVGSISALLGSFFPAWTACRVRVNEVFARTA